MDWTVILLDVCRGSIRISALITAILIPLMIISEIMKDVNFLDRAARFLKPALKFFMLPREAAFPLLGGVFFGITYGSGLIIPFAKNGSLNKRELVIVCIFLSLCHGMIEDTLVFVAIGASWWILVSVRLILAFSAVFFVTRILKKAASSDKCL